MSALLGGGQSSAPTQPALAVGPGEAAGLVQNMAQDAGMNGVGWAPGANAGGPPGSVPTPTGSPTPNLQFDMSSAAGDAANQGNLTLDQLAMLQGQSNLQNQQTAGENAGFQNTSTPGVLGNPSGTGQ